MRSVRIAISRIIGSLSALVALASLASGCSESSSSAGATSGSAGVAALAGAGAGAGGSVSVEAGGGDAASDAADYWPSGCVPYMLPALPVGVRAELADICSAAVEPVVSNAAARVSLTAAAGDLRLPTSGTLTLAASLRDSVRDVPALRVMAPSNRTLLGAELSALAPAPNGYSFVVTWPVTASFNDSGPQVSFLAELDVACDSGSRLVRATTGVQVCGLYSGQQRWVADGGMCVTCYQNQP
ncbi:MAG TPA: hypothetical protein VNG33_14030 [Polyangiaceae bacterium]|nr:hypothetical protein [Polyangiaceae bacterium]